MNHSMTVHVKPPVGNGPVSSAKPVTVLIQVEDQRPPAERDSVFQIVADVGGTDRWNTKKAVPLIVQDAVASEFSKCGHRVVADASSSTDVRVKVALKRFRAFLSTSVLTHSVEAQVDAEVVVANEARKATLPPFRISGNYQRKSGFGTVGAPAADEALREALADFIHNLTFDPRLVEAMQ